MMFLNIKQQVTRTIVGLGAGPSSEFHIAIPDVFSLCTVLLLLLVSLLFALCAQTVEVQPPANYSQYVPSTLFT